MLTPQNKLILHGKSIAAFCVLTLCEDLINMSLPVQEYTHGCHFTLISNSSKSRSRWDAVIFHHFVEIYKEWIICRCIILSHIYQCAL